MKKVYCTVITILLSNIIIAQTDSTKSDFDYYPLQTGNYFEYFSRGWEYPYYYDSSAISITVLGDTVLENGKKYKILFNQNIFGSADYYSYQRIDSSEGSVYEYKNFPNTENHEYKIDSLFAQEGDTIRCSHDSSLQPGQQKTIVSRITVDTVLGFETEIKHLIDISYIPVYQYELAKGFGFYQSSTCEFSCGTSQLVYAKINGQEYGSKIIVSVHNEQKIPVGIRLSQNYPNPFNPFTLINYHLPEESFVVIKIYDVLGKEIAQLVNERKRAGDHEINFIPSDISGGVYFYKIKAGRYTETKKMIFLK